MPLPETKETTVPHTEEQSLIQQLTSMEEWRAAASAWPLKRLVALWNDLPEVAPVQKFTNRVPTGQSQSRASTKPGALQNRNTDQRDAVLRELNTVLLGRSEGGFTTCCCALFHTEGTLTIANHQTPTLFVVTVRFAATPWCPGRSRQLL